ncbi:hypothetical protein [Metabacillus arenae]|uniref:Uncharacterized protein n=1 Tax=Metabacillus arenae TaxID=2771434 RepID=A0A926NFH3_9BACI|nr:hypothetical protein [Metabacillus arenae]MBD1380306.1 hypothetical protein [Metabacillus arenae]
MKIKSICNIFGVILIGIAIAGAALQLNALFDIYQEQISSGQMMMDMGYFWMQVPVNFGTYINAVIWGGVFLIIPYFYEVLKEKNIILREKENIPDNQPFYEENFGAVDRNKEEPLKEEIPEEAKDKDERIFWNG